MCVVNSIAYGPSGNPRALFIVQSDNFGIMSEQVSQQLNDADKSRFSGSLQERISQLRLAIE